MQLVVIDLVPALLTWEGRGSFEPPEARPGALEAVYDLFGDFEIAGVADADHPASEVREGLERLDLAPYFDSVGTSAAFGPVVTPRVVRRVVRAMGADGRAIAVTARRALATELFHAGFPTVETGADPGTLPLAVRQMATGRVNP
ncbi:MAG: hypothetical protein KQH83_09210 [Actinobacteria bacterium]|nr:hypothetical protein [Actinomycetota bacterium]